MRISCCTAILLVPACLFLSCYSEHEAQPVHTPTTFAAQRNMDAIEALKAGRLEEALEKVGQAIEDDPNFHLAYSNKAAILGKLGRHEEAAEVLAEALRRRPDFAQGYVFRGMFLETAGKKEEASSCYAQAIACFDDVIPESGGPEWAVNRAIAVYLLRGKIDGVTAMNDVLKQYPKYMRAAQLKEHMLAGNRDFFLQWAVVPEEANTDTNRLTPAETEE